MTDEGRNSLIGGALFGLAFFQFSEATVPTDANCSYLASPWTDAIAALGGAWCAKRGAELDDSIIAIFGSAVVAIHVMQYVKHKRGK
jgi:hypothetical protein